jgi:hypothetical protein
MLNELDMDWLVDLLVTMAELAGQQMSAIAAALLAEDLAHYPRPVLSVALHRVRTEHVGRLTLKAIIDRIDEVKGRPESDEAWATVLRSFDERDTVAWNEEMIQAALVARVVFDRGDKFGARMAFKNAYERLVREAREQGRMPVVTVSEGWDLQRRAAAIEQAVKLGHISQSQAADFLPAPEPVIDPVLLLGKQCVKRLHIPPDDLAQLRAQRDETASAIFKNKEAMSRRVTDAAAEQTALKVQAQAQYDQYTAPI